MPSYKVREHLAGRRVKVFKLGLARFPHNRVRLGPICCTGRWTLHIRYSIRPLQSAVIFVWLIRVMYRAFVGRVFSAGYAEHMRPPSLTAIFTTWWPLAASWLFMGVEQPLVGALIARLADPTVQLAALGGVVFPLSWLIEAPIMMLLAASTALSKTKGSYRFIYRFMMLSGLALTLLHALLAFTPLYDLLIVRLLQPPAVVVQPARLGLMIMLPFTWCIAYRRFHQGVLIRSGRSLTVSIGTVVRLLAIVLGCSVGLLLDAPGIVVGTLGIVTGVLAEALFIGVRVRPIVRHGLPDKVESEAEPLGWLMFLRFYTPLALTSLLLLLVQPLGSAALSRMPLALTSLAAWPVLASFIFLFRGVGMAYNEVVVAQLETPGAWRSLRRFALLVSALISALLLLVALTPLAHGYFGTVLGLEPELASLASNGLLLAFAWPALTIFQSYYQGILVHSGETQRVTQSVLVSLAVSVLLLGGGRSSARCRGFTS